MTQANTDHKQGISLTSILIVIFGLAVGFMLGIFIPRYLPGMEISNLAVVSSPVVTNPSNNFGQSSTYSDGSDVSSSETENVQIKNISFDIRDRAGVIPIDEQETYVKWMLENTDEEQEYLEKRWELSQKFIKSAELQGQGTIAGFLSAPREHFVRESNIERAYDDTWLPIGYGATITDPDVVAMMTTTLHLGPDQSVLEIGTGSGYQSAILSNISNYVFSIEIIEPLYYETTKLYDDLTTAYPNYTNIKRKLGDGYYGWEKYAPFDRIIVTCSIDHLPPPLIRQLAPDGIMVVPLGPPGRQNIMEVKKIVSSDGGIQLKRRDVYNGVGVRFIPFRDEQGESYSRQ